MVVIGIQGPLLKPFLINKNKNNLKEGNNQ